MGIPIEPRLNPSTLRKWQRIISPSPPTPPSPPRRSPPLAAPGRPLRVSPRRVFGLDRSSLDAMITYYEAYARRRPNHPRKGRLVLVRTLLPHPVRVHRSAVGRLGSRVALMRMLSLSSDGLRGPLRQPLSADDDDDDDALVDDHIAVDEVFEDEEDDDDDNDVVANNRSFFDHVVHANRLTHVPADPTNGVDRLPRTSIGISILYAEEGAPETGRVWELGCWAGAHQLAGVDMFQVFLDVLTEATSIPACRIDSLCVREGLESCNAVSEGIDLLKDLSAELHRSYDRNSSIFLHPITGAPIDIVVGRDED